METSDHDQYVVKVDGSGRLTKRNRRFLRVFKPASMSIENAPTNNSWSSIKHEENQSDCGEVSKPPMITPVSPCGPTSPTLTAASPGSTPGIENSPSMPENRVIMHPTHSAPLCNEPNTKAQKVPAMLKRILPFNSEGLLEGIVAPEDGGRRRLRLSS